MNEEIIQKCIICEDDIEKPCWEERTKIKEQDFDFISDHTHDYIDEEE